MLVGHSYGGLVITGAADRVTERISRLVYLDTVPLPDGGRPHRQVPARAQASRREAGKGAGLEVPDAARRELAEMASLEGLDDYRLALLRSRATPQPFGTYTQPLRLTNPARGTLPKVGIACSFSPERMAQMIAGGRPPVGDRSGPGWRFVGLPTGDADFFNILLPPYSITYVEISAEHFLPERSETRKGHKDAPNRARAPEIEPVRAARG